MILFWDWNLCCCNEFHMFNWFFKLLWNNSETRTKSLLKFFFLKLYFGPLPKTKYDKPNKSKNEILHIVNEVKTDRQAKQYQKAIWPLFCKSLFRLLTCILYANFKWNSLFFYFIENLNIIFCLCLKENSLWVKTG